MHPHTTPQQSARILRGQSMIEQGFEPVEIDNRTFSIHSQSSDKQYSVLHNDKSAAVFNDGFKTYLNFVRPNQALNGKTPAEVAGVDLKFGENRWLNIMKRSAKK